MAGLTEMRVSGLRTQGQTAVLIRSLQASDQDAVQRLVLEILNVEYDMALSLADLPDLADLYGCYRAHEQAHFWVAECRGRIVGCIGVMPLADADYELRRMYVAADCRGMGLAQRLLAVSLQWCRDHQVGALYLETNTQWQAAQAIYAKHGFEAIAREQLPPTFPIVRIATNFYRLRFRSNPNSPTTSAPA